MLVLVHPHQNPIIEPIVGPLVDLKPSIPKPNPPIPKPNPSTKAKNWASLFRSQGPSKTMKLEYYPELRQGKYATVELDISHPD